MSTYIRFLEMLVTAPDMSEAYKRMLKGKDLKASGEQVKQYITSHARLCSNPIYETSPLHKKDGPKVQFVAYYVFPFVTNGPLKNVGNLIKLYNFFFVAERVVVSTKYSYEENYAEKVENPNK